MLKNLESKVREQDAYWTKVVLMKDNEITNLKDHVEQSWAGNFINFNNFKNILIKVNF